MHFISIDRYCRLLVFQNHDLARMALSADRRFLAIDRQHVSVDRYAPNVVTNNATMVEYFILGLRPELQDVVIPLLCGTVEKSAQRAAILERTIQTRQSGGSGSFWLPQQSPGAKEVAGNKVFSKTEILGWRRRSHNKVLPLQLESAVVPLVVPLVGPVLPAGSVVATPLLPSLQTADLLSASAGTVQVPGTSSSTTAPKCLAGAGVETTAAAALPTATGRPATTEHQAARTAEVDHQPACARLQPTRPVRCPNDPLALELACVYMETPFSDTSVVAPMPGPSAPTKDLTIGTAAHGSEDAEGLTEQHTPRVKYTSLGNTAHRDAIYYGLVSSARRGRCRCDVSPVKEGMSFTKKPSMDYQSPTGSNSIIDLYV
ncbi:hypothetical protein Taro_049461 [Colocasia esculenta]|uniref:Uncharacterized protein n=1 Tax=Colocasia esculenta TaxID=4460 RepID=A0A843XB22_COLES|nr:hypothetical protein [Colocasia esculenta]